MILIAAQYADNVAAFMQIVDQIHGGDCGSVVFFPQHIRHYSYIHQALPRFFRNNFFFLCSLSPTTER